MDIHNFEELLGQVLQLPVRDGNQQLILKLIVLWRSIWSLHPSPSHLNLSVLEIINNIQYLKEWGQVAYVDPSFCKMVGQVPQLWIRNGTDTDTKNWQCSEELSKVLHPSLSCLKSSTFTIPKHEVNLSVCSLASPTHHQCYVPLIFYELWLTSLCLTGFTGTTEGSRDEGVQKFVMDAMRHGYFPVVLNPRGCAASPLTTPRHFIYPCDKKYQFLVATKWL